MRHYQVTDYRHNNGRGLKITAECQEQAAERFAQRAYGYGGFSSVTPRRKHGPGNWNCHNNNGEIVDLYVRELSR
jgi:hypothetical protein